MAEGDGPTGRRHASRRRSCLELEGDSAFSSKQCHCTTVASGIRGRFDWRRLSEWV